MWRYSVTNQRFAVVIGVDDSGVNVTLPNLRCAERDAQVIRDVVSDPVIGTFDPKDVKLFAGPCTTAAEIKAVLHHIVINSDQSDVLLVYFAGHTLTPAWSHGTDTYLVTPDLDESALFDNPNAGLRLAFLKRDILEHFAGTALLVLDCCRAGNLVAASDRGIDMISFGGRGAARYCALMACAPDGVAREDPERGHGLLTYHLLRALRGRAMDDRGRVTFQAMSAYVMDQGLVPEPGLVTRSWGSTTVLTRPGHEAAGAGRQVPAPVPEAMEIVPLDNPLQRSAAAISRLIGRLSRSARESRHSSSSPPGDGGPDAGDAVSRVEYLKAALGADSVALLEYAAAGFRTIDATARFDQDDVQHLFRSAGDVAFPLNPEWFGHLTRDDTRTMLCAPLSRTDGKCLLLAVVNPPAALLEIGQPLAKVLETVWRTDFAAYPAEAEIQVMTDLRQAFGRLPTSLYERCFQLYREVLGSFSIVFQSVITIGPAPRNVGVHSYEALARRSPEDQRAPVAMLQVAHVWGDRFVVERDKVILRKALKAYARAHADGPWDLPKPVSVNVAVRSLLSDSYVEALREAIAAAHLDAPDVTLEISEQDPIEPRVGEQWPDEPHAYFHKRLAEIARDVGVAFAVDDFGVGYASLSRMAELPLTQIKVDRAVLHHPLALKELSLVVDVARYATDRGDAHAPRVVIVEGVDDESPLSLRQIFEQRIRHVQGFITRQPASPVLRRLRPEVRTDIAARVRGDEEHRQTGITRGDSDGRGHSLRRGA